MANLKDLRVRIASVRSTQKITSAMKMVAASKLRRAQAEAEAARPYADRMQSMMCTLGATLPTLEGAPKLLAGSGGDQIHLLIPVTADRGLCGGFNSSIVRETRRRVANLEKAGKTVKVIAIGRKGKEALRRELGGRLIESHENLTKTGAQFSSAREISNRLRDLFEKGDFDVCTLIFNHFKSAISQEVTPQQIIPCPMTKARDDIASFVPEHMRPLHIMEPSEEEILGELLPRNLEVQIFRAMLEGFASEQGARMTAMDNATRNAGEMIDSLTLIYNRTRQAVITKELIEIISGAEAL